MIRCEKESGLTSIWQKLCDAYGKLKAYQPGAYQALHEAGITSQQLVHLSRVSYPIGLAQFALEHFAASVTR